MSSADPRGEVRWLATLLAALMSLALGGCECGSSESTQAPVSTGEALQLPDQVVLSNEALAPLGHGPDASRSGRYAGPSPMVLRVPPERGPIVAADGNGTVRWEADVGRLHPGAAIVDGVLVVRGRTANEDGIIQPTLTAIELTSGTVRWRHRDTEALHFGVPTGAGREVYAMRVTPERCLGVAVVDVQTGEANDPIETSCLRFVQTHPLELAEASLRPDGEGGLFLGRSEGDVHALTGLGLDGTVNWRREGALGTQAPTAPVVLSGALLTLDRGVHALDRETGEVLWSAPMTAREMAVADGRVAVTDGETVRVLDASDGAVRFELTLPGPARSPRLHGDLLLVETRGRLHAFSTEDGASRWRYVSPDRISSIAIADDAVFVATTRRLVRLSRADGAASELADAAGHHVVLALP